MGNRTCVGTFSGGCYVQFFRCIVDAETLHSKQINCECSYKMESKWAIELNVVRVDISRRKLSTFANYWRRICLSDYLG